MSKKKVALVEPDRLREDEDGFEGSRKSAKKAIIETKFESLLIEKRILLAAFFVGVLATTLFIVSFSTEFWIYVKLDRPQPRDDPQRGKFLKTGHYHGLWKICREELWYVNRTASNATEPVLYCRKMFFSLPDWMHKTYNTERRNMELKMLDFRRSTIAVGFIALMLAFMSHAFTFYSLDQLRYMYKRLAGCLHLITGASCWVTLEVFRQMHLYEEKNMKENVAEFAEIKYGWSYNLIWFELILYLIPGVILLVCSRKKKRSKARSLKEARENEPVVLGR